MRGWVTLGLGLLCGCAAGVGPEPSAGPGLGDFDAVATRVLASAGEMCRARRPEAEPGTCAFRLMRFADPALAPNAFLTEGRDGRPVIVITDTLIAASADADELAFVMGHEAAHQVADHTGRANALRRSLDATGPLAAAPTDSERSLDLRALELEADALGAQVARRAGYDPAAGVEIFARGILGPAAERGTGSHPPAALRRAAVLGALALSPD